MSCVISYQDLQETLLEAYKTDFEKYKNISAIIQDVMALGNLPQESKIHAIWFYAGYINTAASSIEDLQTKEWKDGKYAAIHNYLTPLLTGKAEFNYDNIIGEIQKILKVNLDTETQTTEDKIREDIADLKKIPDEKLLENIDGVIKNILDNTDVLDPVMIDPNNTLALELLNSLRDTLANMDKPNPYYIARVGSVIAELRESYDIGESYVDLSRIRDIGIYNNEPIKKIRKHEDGTFYEVVYDRAQGKFLYYNPGQSNHLTPLDIVEYKDVITEILTEKNNPSDVNAKNGNLRLSLEDIATGIFLGKSYTYGTTNELLDTTIETRISEATAAGHNFMDSIDITATMKGSNLLAKRKERIDAAFPNNRVPVETYEYPAARKILKTGKGPILTYSMPTDSFDIVVSTKDGEFSFMPISSAKNLVFLYPDNTVEKVDFKNPQHRNLLKSKLEIRNLEWDYDRMSLYHPATDEEVDKLEKAVERYNEFSKEVTEKLAEAGNEDVSIKDIFNKYYNLSNNIVSIEFGTGQVVKSSLQEHIDKFDGRLSADIIDENGEKLPFQKTPIIIVRNKNGFMEFVNPLKLGQKIVGENGKSYESFKVFMEENYPTIDIQQIGKKIPQRNAAYINLIPTTYGYRSTINPLNYSTAVDTDFAKANLAATMMLSFEKGFITKGNTFMQNFNNSFWGFNLTDSNIYPEFVIRNQKADGSKTFGIGFDILNKKADPTSDKTLYTPEEISEFKSYAKKNLNFVIMDDVLYGPDGLFTVVKEIFKDAGVTIPAGVSVKEIGDLATEALSKVKNPNLVKRLNQAYINLSADIRSRFNYVVSKADHPLVDENFKKNALFNGEDGDLNLKNRTKQGFDKNPVSNFVVVDAENLKTQLRIFPKDYSQRISYLPPTAIQAMSDTGAETDAGVIVSTNPPVVNPSDIKDDTGPADKPRDDEGDDGIIPTQNDDIGFSVVQSLQGVMMLSESEFAKEIAAMKELLPDTFTFTAEDLTGLNINGEALGYIKRLSIFLNSTVRAKGVAYHEGFHGVFRNLLTTKQQQYYLSRAAKSLGDYKEDENGKYISVRGEKVYANEFRKDRRFIHLTDEQVKNLIYEEYLADSFADYMETNKAPRTWMEKLFAWLKSIINKFRKEGDIQNLFYDISAGKFKNVSIRDTISNTETAYSVYKGISYLKLRDVTKPYSKTANPVVQYNPVVQSSVTAELSSKIVKRMIELKNIHLGHYVEKDMSSEFPLGVSPVFSAKTKVTEEDLYDIAAADVAKEYDINKLIAQKPNLEKEIRDTFEDSWNNAKWLLGEFHKDNATFKLKNDTGLTSFDNMTLSKNDKAQVAASIANAELFKSDVIAEYKNLDVIDSENEEDEVSNYEKENYKDTQSFITSPPDEGDSAFQQLFKYISYDYVDPILGVKYKRMVDPRNIFNIIRKITSRTIDKIKLIPSIQDQITISTDIINNFYLNIQPNLIDKNVIPEDIAKQIDLRDSLRAVLNTLNDIVEFDESLMPKKNSHVFNQFLKVFNLVDITSSQINLETSFSRNKEKGIYEPKDQIYRMSDIVVGVDINKIRQDLYERLRLLNVSDAVLLNAIEALDSVKELGDKDVVMSKYTTNGVFNEAAMKKLVQKVYTQLSNLNLGIPYNVIEIALTYEASKSYGKDKINYFPLGTHSRKILSANKNILHKISKLNSKLFSQSLPNVLRLANRAGSLTTNPELLKYANIFLYVYSSNAGEFILNNDPTFAGSTTKNANGDMVQKFVRPVPSIIALLKLQSKDTIEEGLEELIKEDFEGFESYFEDNPLLDLSKEKNAFFLENMKISAFAGFQQTQLINNVEGFEKTRESTTFSDIDDKSYALSMMGLFANREVNTIEEGTSDKKEKVVFFKRILSQFEGTSTSMVVDGIYQDFVKETYDVVDGKTTKITSKIIDQNGVSSVANYLMSAAKQEFNSIRKNFTDKRLNNPVQKFENYNIEENQRGFTFTDCADFFALNVDPSKVEANEDLKDRVQLANSLIEAAKTDKDFDQFLKENPELYQRLVSQLDKFADEQYKVFDVLLKKLNIKDFDLPTVEQIRGKENNETFFPEKFKKEFFFNTWVNGIFINQLFEGQKSVGLKNAADYFKRQKSGAAAGSNISVATSKVKNARVAVVQKIEFWINNKQLNNQQVLEKPPLDANGKVLDGWEKVQLFDGQSLNSLNRIRKILDSQGKLTSDVDKILKTMRFHVGETDASYTRAIKRLADAGIVFNSLKTVSASPMFYIKQSEHTILRKDVSVLKPEYRTGSEFRGKDLSRRMAFQKLEELWEMADFYSTMLEEGSLEKMEEYQQKYNFVIRKIHSYYQPIKGKEALHNILNSMELHRVDQFMDVNATKRAVVETTKFNLSDVYNDNFYLDLSKSTFKVPNVYTFIQVETGHTLNSITQGIQQKLLIMTQLDYNSPEYKQIKNDIRKYSASLADVVDSQLENIKRIVDGNSGGLISELYTNIADGLRAQGNSADLKWFELDDNGEIKYDPNLPAVSKAIEYYLYSFFNKNLFDKKVNGKKYYHVSPFGYRLREQNGKIITQDEYLKDPEKYADSTVRYPEIKEEEVEFLNKETGKKEKVKRYVVEVIVPKELRDVDQKLLEKYMAEKWRDTFFGTRIPTEGKRSMMVCKIVDYLDEAYGNSIIVPFQLHMMAGSDFDIDSLYTYKYDTYRSISGEKIMYGDYSYYMQKYNMTKDEAKFIEYLTYVSKDSLYSAAINNEIKRINQQATHLVLKKRNTSSATKTKMNILQNIRSSFGRTNITKLLDNISRNPEDYDSVIRFIATFNVLKKLEDSNLPTTVAQLKNSKINHVPYVTFNEILESKIRILQDPSVFQKFMADENERADAAAGPYATLTNELNLSEKEIYARQHVATPTALIEARSLNSEFKDCLGIAASLNKIISLLETINAQLNDPIAAIYTPESGKKQKVIEGIGKGAVQRVGGAVGVFADAIKNPYPGPLNLNFYNTPVYLTMTALDVPLRGAIMYQSLPMIKNAILEFRESSKSFYASKLRQRPISFQKFLNGKLKELAASSEIDTSIFKDKKIVNFKLEWTDKVSPTTDDQIISGNIPITNFGWKLTDLRGNPFNKETEELILLDLFNKFLAVSNDLSFTLNKVTDVLKSLNPDQDKIDKLLNTIKSLKTGNSGSFFKESTIKKLFDNNPVLDASLKALEYVSKSSKKILLEKTSFMKGMTSLFSSFLAYEDDFDTKSEIRNDIKASVALYFQRLVAESNPDSFINSLYLEQLNAANFLSDQTVNDFRELKAKFPRNQFLMNISPVTEGSPNLKIATLLETRSGISSKTKESMENDLTFLLSHADPDVRNKAYRIVFHGIIKSGAQKVKGSYYDILPAALSRGMSERLKTFREDLVDLDSFVQKRYKIDPITNAIPDAVKAEYRSRLNQIINKNFGGATSEDFITSVIVKIISSKVKTEDYVKNVINLSRVDISPLDLYNFVRTVTPSVNNIISVTKNGSAISYSKPVMAQDALADSEYELFSPLGNTFLLDLTNIDIENNPVAKSILINQGIRYNTDSFSFPLYKINAYNQLLVLKQLDDKSVGDAFIDTLSETDLNTSDGPRQLTGKKALYEVVAREGSDKISPLAFSHDAGVEIRNTLYPVQQMTSDVLSALPKVFTINDTLGRMFVMNKAQMPTNEYRNKQFITTDGKVISVGNRFMKYFIKDGKLFSKVNGVSQDIEIISSRLDAFAQVLKKGSWENLKNDLNFESFFNGEKNIFVYDLNSSEIPVIREVAPTEEIERKTPEFDKLPGKSKTPTMTYAGIGSRETPEAVLKVMTEAAKYLDQQGFTLNTGKTYPAKPSTDPKYQKQYEERLAFSKKNDGKVGLDEEGADRAFSLGTTKKNLFGVDKPVGEREMTVMKEIHPNPGALKEGAKKLMARNTNQIFGKNLDTPVDFVLAYDPSGWTGVGPRPKKGGTLQAIDMAARKGIPVINMADSNWKEQLKNLVANKTKLPKGQKVKEGIYVNQGALSKEEQLEIFNYLKPFLEEQAAKTNKGKDASKMIGLELRWDYISNNKTAALNIPDIIEPGSKAKFGYYTLSINGKPLGNITPRLRQLIEKASGVDMTNYDGAIINLYDNNSFISSHNDVDESSSAINYPVVGINIGGKGNFSIEPRDGSNDQMLDLESGTAYIFGVNGTNRKVYHRTFASPQNSFLPELTTKLDGKTYPAGSYRVTITMRRVKPLESGMPTSPFETKTKVTVSPSQEIAPGVSLTQDQINLAKQNKVQQNFYDKKPYAKEQDANGNVTKWEVYKSKNGKSSMQASLDGDRTESTRSPQEIQKLKDVAKSQGLTGGITGAIIWMEGQVDNVKNSTNIKGDWFKITSEPYTPNQKDFNAYENWESNVWRDRSSEFRIGQENEWKSVRFERVSKPASNVAIKPQVQEVFDSNPELAKIGTPQQYSTYLDSIFPESQVKDVLYHGTQYGKFDQFDKKKLGLNTEAPSSMLGFFFSDSFANAASYSTIVDKNWGTKSAEEQIEESYNKKYDEYKPLYNELIEKEGYTDKRNDLGDGKVINNKSGEILYFDTFEFQNNISEFTKAHKTFLEVVEKVEKKVQEVKDENRKQQIFSVMLNIKSLATFDKKGESGNIASLLKDVKTVNNTKNINDGVVLKNYKDPFISNVYVVFEPEQIHILGNKKDIEGFKKFVNSPTTQPTPIEPTRTEDTGYRYYGAPYTIIVENGVGVDVKDYKGKPAAKKKLLDAYNANPDVDPQSGKQFRNFTPKKEDGPKKEEEDNKYELFPGVYANEGQKNAIDKIENFLDGKSDQFLLKGRGGTGKTTIIKKAIAGIPPGKVIGATVADEARGILQENMPGYATVTVASLLGLIPDYNPRTGEIFFREKEEDERSINKFTGEPMPDPIEKASYIIIDEASMIDDATYEMLLSRKKPDAKIIFMGDNVQIPPINNESKDSPVWQLATGENFAELNERMRQGKESPILGITDLYAENVENIQENRPSVANPLTTRVSQFENGEGVLFLNKREDFINQYVDEITNTKSSKQAIVVGATNKVVDAVNDVVRQKIFDTSEPFVENDLVRVNTPSVLKDQDGKIIGLLPNGYKAIVTGVEEVNVISAGKESVQLYKLDLEHEGFNKEGKPIKENKTIFTVNPKEKGLIKSVLNSLAIEAKKYPKGTQDSKKAWAKFFNLKESIVDIGYAYAITSHKVQGSTYNSAYVLEADIMNFPGGREQTNRMMYTAVSRPRKKLVIYNPTAEIGEKKTATSNIMGNLEDQKDLDNQINSVINDKKEDSIKCNGG